MPIDQAEAIVLRTSPIGDQDKLAVLSYPGQGRPARRGQGRPQVRQPVREQPGADVPASRVFYYEKERRDLGHGQQLRSSRVLLRHAEGPEGGLHPELLRRAHRRVRPVPVRGRGPVRLVLVGFPLPGDGGSLPVPHRLLRSLVLASADLPPRLHPLQGMPQAPGRPLLAVAEKGRCLLRGLHPVEKG